MYGQYWIKSKSRACSVLHGREGKNQSLAPSKTDQVRATEHVMWFYSAHPDQHSKFGHWGHETTVWSFVLQSQIFLSTFIHSSFNQSIQTSTYYVPGTKRRLAHILKRSYFQHAILSDDMVVQMAHVFTNLHQWFESQGCQQ